MGRSSSPGKIDRNNKKKLHTVIEELPNANMVVGTVRGAQITHSPVFNGSEERSDKKNKKKQFDARTRQLYAKTLRLLPIPLAVWEGEAPQLRFNN